MLAIKSQFLILQWSTGLQIRVGGPKMKNRNKNMIVIFRPYMDLKNGKRIYAKDYGKKAFRIEVPVNKKRK